MPIVTLTDRFCANTKANGGRVDYFDEKTRGLALRIAPSGVKTFTLHYGPAKKRARLTLGRYPSVTLARARTLAIEALGRVADGEDPRPGTAATVRDLWALYEAQHVKPQLRTAAAVKRRIEKNVLPTIGDKRLIDLHKRDITSAITPILGRGKAIEANRVFEDVRGMLRWGTAQGHLDVNPATGMQKPGAISLPRERTLDDAEIRTLWNGLPKALPRSKVCRNIIKLALMTGQRVGECAGIEPVEIDAKARLWTIPAERSKNGHKHTVPLTKAALVIAQLLGDGEKLPPHVVAKTVRLAQDRFGIVQWTMHDLRRTAITEMARLGVSPIVLGHVINHRSVTRAGVTLAVYSQYDYAAEKKQALELWAKKLASIVRP